MALFEFKIIRSVTMKNRTPNLSSETHKIFIQLIETRHIKYNVYTCQ